MRLGKNSFEEKYGRSFWPDLKPMLFDRRLWGNNIVDLT